MSSRNTWFQDTDPRASKLTAPPRHAAPDPYWAVLQRLVLSTPGVRAAVLAKASGAEQCAYMREPLALQPMGGVASALWAMGSAMLDRSAGGACRHVLIESGNGAILLMDVVGSDLLLTTVADRSAMLSHVLWTAQRCCEQLRLAAIAPNAANPSPSQ
jgi:predicted regulator of Ras-like GTPase activity (Roadblock/LC7/MglB family)